MSVVKNRSSLLAIEVESTIGTYVPPASGSHFIALHEGFKFSPNFNLLENAEIRSSIGKAQTIQGLEQPTASFDHYLRAGGTAGTAPGYGVLIKSIMGASTSNATERVTTGTSSTVSVVNLAAGGSDFARGFAVMNKSTLYEIRPVHSVSTNALTMGFNFLVAPNTAGIGMGKCVNYSPADTGHPSLSLTLYRGNGGAVEALAGCYVNQVTFKMAAGALINASFQVQAVKYLLNPVVVTASNKFIDFTDDDGTASAAITVGTYRDPFEFADAVTAALNAANVGEVHTCTYNKATGTYKISSTGTVLSLLWKTGTHGSDNTNTSAVLLLGYPAGADLSGTAAGTGYTGSAVAQAAVLTPSYDNADPQVAKANEVLIGDNTDTSIFSASTVDFTVTNAIENVEDVNADSGVREKFISTRTIELKIVGVLKAYDVDLFKRYRSNADVRFCYNFGTKTGGNWVPGTACCIYVPVAKVSAHELGDNKGLATVEITVTPYVDNSGNGEFYINFL